MNCHCFGKLILSYGVIDDAGPSWIYCEDMRPSNMLVDPDTLEITAVLDFACTNALQAQYAYDLPWWLLLRRPITPLETITVEELFNLFIPPNKISSFELLNGSRPKVACGPVTAVCWSECRSLGIVGGFGSILHRVTACFVRETIPI